MISFLIRKRKENYLFPSDIKFAFKLPCLKELKCELINLFGAIGNSDF